MRTSRFNNKQKNYSRTKDGTIPRGRTFMTRDNHLSGAETGSTKKRTVVVLTSNKHNELAVVPLSGHDGHNRTKLPNYLGGKSYFKHFVEIEDVEGNPIKPNDKFRENHPNMDVSAKDMTTIYKKVTTNSSPAQRNCKALKRFRNRDFKRK